RSSSSTRLGADCSKTSLQPASPAASRSVRNPFVACMGASEGDVDGEHDRGQLGRIVLLQPGEQLRHEVGLGIEPGPAGPGVEIASRYTDGCVTSTQEARILPGNLVLG